MPAKAGIPSVREISANDSKISGWGNMKTYYVYMMANKYNNVLYTGITNDLVRRVYEHKNGLIEGFTKQYNCHKLVWYESTNDVEAAILREKRMKKWKREYKENLINAMNPEWKDLSDGLF